MTISIESATNLLLHAWEQEWGPTETTEVLKIAGADRGTILVALEKARAIIKG